MLKKSIPLMLVPFSFNACLEKTALKIQDELAKQDLTVSFFRLATVISIDIVESFLAENKQLELLDKIAASYELIDKKSDFIIIEGLPLSSETPYAQKLNDDIAEALDALIILVGTTQKNDSGKFNLLSKITANHYKHSLNREIISCIVNATDSEDIILDLSHLQALKTYEQRVTPPFFVIDCSILQKQLIKK